jgi:hypothetical protein
MTKDTRTKDLGDRAEVEGMEGRKWERNRYRKEEVEGIQSNMEKWGKKI